MNVAKHISLAELSDRTGLPIAWLRREAERGRIPSLRVGRRRMFDPVAVSAALRLLSGEAGKEDGHDRS